ncbi:hypothetical protein Acr_15g0004920 [Actinidia rufa]|uniref:Uncharacterized protein n=1 Tax=Actinidia rufa TaxID=165716 RepID=A0A7J0FT62_9ERIC|nr:hypothetical protein Acr_15g0004920 [Actinidia rufa]
MNRRAASQLLYFEARGARKNHDEEDDGNHQESVIGGGASALGENVGGAPPTTLGGAEFMQGVFTAIEQVGDALQWWKTMEEVVAKKFAKAFVSTEEEKAKQFMRGLRPSIRNKIAENLIKVYSTMVSTAAANEETLNETRKIQNPKWVISVDSACRGRTVRELRDHNNPLGQRMQGRVYAINVSSGTVRDSWTAEQQLDTSVVRGTLLMFNSWARVLINTGASHSFIASSFASALGLEIETVFDIELPFLHPREIVFILWEIEDVVLSLRLQMKLLSVLASISIHEWKMLQDIGEYDLLLGETKEFATLFTLSAKPSIINRVIEAQQQDVEAKTICDRIARGVGSTCWVLHADRGLRYKSRLFVPLSCRDDVLRPKEGEGPSRQPQE